MKKLWGGRFTQGAAKSVEAFTQSISFDKRLAFYDIAGSTAHAKMLAKQGIITQKEAKEIITGLNKIKKQIILSTFDFKVELEDIHMNIESALTEMYPDSGRKLHTARSRNDQVALDLRLYLRDVTKNIIELIKNFQNILVDISEKHLNTIMPGYTHLQRAQPVLLAHHLLAYVEMFQRDRERLSDCLKRVNTLPLGACAMSGTTLNIDRDYVAKELKFARISENSMDAVSDRDFVIEFISHCSIIMMHLSRMAEELVLWSTGEFSFIEISDAYTTGSSIMPQKKNPDVAELIRGKTGRVYGALMSILTIMKALPLTYNRDMQEDKIPLFDTCDTVSASLQIINEMFHHINFNAMRLRETASSGFSLATDLAEYLVRKGIPFRAAHEITGNIVKYCVELDETLEKIPLSVFKSFSDSIEEDVYQCLNLDDAVNNKNSRGGTSMNEVQKQIQRFKKLLRMR
ncbi:argininosuccinate lyase [Candidatus Magnetomonas plexicatena]|uniref:argininosuccinate lyase n=1 Tax=Candidatus Magnetomonas plexicatena TaxID=2552947 RepID=UPI001C772DAA|nr:argininosuccinate lyase [Nitrospirales bacterium LBB_01]